jgi:hypothetical protein
MAVSLVPNKEIWAIVVELLPSPLAQNKWKGTIEIYSTATLEELHLAIQDAVKFENDHLYEFYVSEDERSRERKAFSLEDGSILSTKLVDIFPVEKGKNLFYWFDFGDDWMFKITKSKSGIKYPRLASQTGKKPVQYPDYDDE